MVLYPNSVSYSQPQQRSICPRLQVVNQICWEVAPVIAWPKIHCAVGVASRWRWPWHLGVSASTSKDAPWIMALICSNNAWTVRWNCVSKKEHCWNQCEVNHQIDRMWDISPLFLGHTVPFKTAMSLNKKSVLMCWRVSYLETLDGCFLSLASPGTTLRSCRQCFRNIFSRCVAKQ